MLPDVNLRPPFNITRASHVVLHVADLARSRDFYVNIVGLVISEEGEGVCYLRGLAEACHHSLVLVQSQGGVVRVESAVNKGSSFYFTLPCTEFTRS